MNDWRRSYSTDEMADVYRRSAVVVNDPIRGDVNMRFFEAMVFINLFWPLLNLLPIWPLDGGQITREACVGALGQQRGLSISLGISLVVAIYSSEDGSEPAPQPQLITS